MHSEGTDDVGVALVGGAPCGTGGKSATVTSAITCTHTHTHTHKGKRKGEHMNNETIVSQVTVW